MPTDINRCSQSQESERHANCISWWYGIYRHYLFLAIVLKKIPKSGKKARGFTIGAPHGKVMNYN